MITRANYEKYAIDYIEGKLSDKQLEEFEQFLLQNPDIASEIQEISGLTVKNLATSSSAAYNNKFELKKSIIPGLTYFDQLCIDAIEGNITDEQLHELQEIIRNDKHKALIYEQYKLTKLKAPYYLYPYKSQLKRRNIFNELVRYAAVIIIFFSLFMFEKNNQRITSMLIERKINQPALSAITPIVDPFIELKTNTEQIAKSTVASSAQKTKYEKSITPEPIDTTIMFIKPKSITICTNYANLDTIKLLNSKLLQQQPQELSRKIIENIEIISTNNITIKQNQFTITINNKTYGICLR